MTNEEIALCLSIINKNAASINITLDDKDRHFTIISDIKKENVTWVIDEAIKALRGGA